MSGHGSRPHTAHLMRSGRVDTPASKCSLPSVFIQNTQKPRTIIFTSFFFRQQLKKKKKMDLFIFVELFAVSGWNESYFNGFLHSSLFAVIPRWCATRVVYFLLLKDLVLAVYFRQFLGKLWRQRLISYYYIFFLLKFFMLPFGTSQMMKKCLLRHSLKEKFVCMVDFWRIVLTLFFVGEIRNRQVLLTYF